jgi:hypothetical protein
MTVMTGLRDLAKTRAPAVVDETPSLSPEPAPPYIAPPRFTPFVPAPRGRSAPVVGTIEERDTLRALAQSGGGWLHKDGRIVANGSLFGVDALRTLPELAPLLERLDGEAVAAKAAKETERDELLAGYLAKGKTDDDFLDDAQESDLYDQLDQDHPGPDVAGELERAGWISLRLRQDRGVKEVAVSGRQSESPAHAGHLETLCSRLGCTLNGRSPKANVVDDTANDEDLTTKPGF